MLCHLSPSSAATEYTLMRQDDDDTAIVQPPHKAAGYNGTKTPRHCPPDAKKKYSHRYSGMGTCTERRHDISNYPIEDSYRYCADFWAFAILCPSAACLHLDSIRCGCGGGSSALRATLRATLRNVARNVARNDDQDQQALHAVQGGKTLPSP